MIKALPRSARGGGGATELPPPPHPHPPLQGLGGLRDACRLALLSLGAGLSGLGREQFEFLLTKLRPRGSAPPTRAALDAAWRAADRDGDGHVGLDDLAAWAAANPRGVEAARAAILGFPDEAAFLGDEAEVLGSRRAAAGGSSLAPSPATVAVFVAVLAAVVLFIVAARALAARATG